MGKLLLLLLIVALFFVMRALIRSRNEAARAPRRSQQTAERMVNCKHCGLYLPESEALVARGEHYCCEQHRRLADR